MDVLNIIKEWIVENPKYCGGIHICHGTEFTTKQRQCFVKLDQTIEITIKQLKSLYPSAYYIIDGECVTYIHSLNIINIFDVSPSDGGIMILHKNEYSLIDPNFFDKLIETFRSDPCSNNKQNECI